jgi:hypothetical protein
MVKVIQNKDMEVKNEFSTREAYKLINILGLPLLLSDINKNLSVKEITQQLKNLGVHKSLVIKDNTIVYVHKYNLLKNMSFYMTATDMDFKSIWTSLVVFAKRNDLSYKSFGDAMFEIGRKHDKLKNLCVCIGKRQFESLRYIKTLMSEDDIKHISDKAKKLICLFNKPIDPQLILDDIDDEVKSRLLAQNKKFIWSLLLTTGDFLYVRPLRISMLDIPMDEKTLTQKAFEAITASSENKTMQELFNQLKSSGDAGNIHGLRCAISSNQNIARKGKYFVAV